MEDTQAINWEVEEEEETERPSESLGCCLEPLGRLHIFSSVHGPEKDFPLYLGRNVVGRMPDCSVALPFPSISKQHAVIEILAWDKAPVLRDCGSLNGTQILSPPKVLSPGVSHRLRDQELVVFADLPCQYHRLDVPLPFVSRGCLTVEETPRVQGGTQPQGLLLAEDSEEEIDPLPERYVVKEARSTSSLMAIVVPESDEEGPSPAPDGPGPPLAFHLDSDTDEEESQQPAAGEASSAATSDAIAKIEQPKAVITELQLEEHQCPVKERSNDTEVKRDTSNEVVPVGVILESSQSAGEDSETDVDDESRPPGRPAEVHLQAQPSGFTDSDTDVEEVGVPVTPAVVPVNKKQIFQEFSARSPGGPGLARLQESLAGSETDVGEGTAPLMAPLERSQASVAIDSNAGDEEEVLAALTLACLKESRAAVWNRDTDVEEDRAQSVSLLEWSQTSSGRDSDTDVEEEELPVEKRESVPKGHTDKVHSEKSQPLFGDSDKKMEEDKSSPRVHLERSQASTTVGISTPAEEEVPAGPAGALWEKHQVPVAWTSQTNVEAEGSPTKLPVGHLEEARPPPGIPGEPTQPQSKGAQPLTESGREPCVDMTRDSGDNHGDSEDLDLQATQCFAERENQSLEAVQSMDDEPTQAFLPQEPGPSYCSSQDPGALDAPWELFPTQPFCPRESEASESQPIAAYFEAHGSCSSPPRATPQDPHPESPVHAEPLRIPGRELQTMEKGMGTPRETADRVTPERGPLERETKKLPPEGEREDVMGEEELTRVIQDQEQKQVLARATQRPESDKTVRSASTEKDMESLKVEMEAPKELQEKELAEQTLGREIFEREAERLAPEREYGPGRLEVNIPKVILEGGAWRGDTERGNQGLRGQACSPTPRPEVGTGDLQGLASGSQSGGEREAPVNPRRQQRGHSNCKLSPAEKASGGHPEPLDAYLPPTVPEASAPLQNPLISQSQKHPAPQPRSSPSPPLQLPIPRTRQKRSQEAAETPSSSELGPLHAKPKGRPQGSSRMTPSPVSSMALEPHPTSPTDQPVSPEPTSWANQRRTHRSSEVTPAPVVPTAPELQHSTSTDRPVTPKPTSRGRTHRSSVKTTEPIVPTAPELHHSTFTDRPVTPKPTSRATRGRTHRSSVKTPKSVVPTAPELQHSTSTDRPVTPKPTSRGRTHRSSVKTTEPIVPTAPELQHSTSTDRPVTPKPTSRGRTHTSSVKTTEPIVPTAPELHHSTSTDRPVTPKPTSRATRGRTHRSSVKTPESVVPTAPELQHSTSTDRLVTPKPTSRGRTHRSSVKTTEPIVPTAPELQHSTSKDQPLTPKPTFWATRGRTHRSSVRTLESVVPTAPELQHSTSTDRPITPKPTSRATWGRTHRSSVKTHQPTESTAPDLKPPTPTDQPVTPKTIAQGDQSRILRSTSAVLVPTILEFQSPVPTDQPVSPESITQANCSRRPRATRKHGLLTAPTAHEPCSVPPQPDSRSAGNQRRGAVRAIESLRTIPGPTWARLPEAPTHASQIQKVEAAGRYGFTPEAQPKASQNKRTLGTVDSPPLQKRLKRGQVPQKTAFLKEENVVIPGPSKRKRDQAEEEPKGTPGRSLRRTKPNHESTAPKVLFTGVVDAQAERAVLALGGSLASSVAEASYLVTDRIRRTVKFLCALGRGIPILSLDWLHQSHRAGRFLPPDEYVVTDPEQEKHFGFSLQDALSRARKQRLLEGYEIHVTPGVQPPPAQMGEIISCCGGTVLPSMPRSYKPHRVVITCSQDFPRCSIPFRIGLPILSPEFLLTGVLKQEAKPEAFVLSTVEMSAT